MEAMITLGNFCCSSLCHSSLVPMVLNTRTGKISPQFHVVFNDWLTRVASVSGEKAFNPSQWQELFTTLRYQYMFDLTNQNVVLEEWIDNSLEHDHK